MKKIFNFQIGFHHQRPFIEYALNFKGWGLDYLIGAEIGVLDGDNAFNILKTNKIKKLYLIDIEKTPNASDLLLGFPVKWIVKDSNTAHKDIQEPLDFVYIDGDHSYEQVKKDLNIYYRKIKIGGLIGGHDFCYSSTKKGEGVIQAVTEFCVKRNIKLFVESPDWWFWKGTKYDKTNNIHKT